MNKLLSVLAALVIALWVVGPAGAQEAGPTFEDSGPDQGDLEHEAPREIFIQFSEPLDPSSSAQVYDECGRRLDDGQADIRGDTLWAQVALRPSGRYLVVYSATGGGAEPATSDGSFTFRVHFGPSCGGKPGPSGDGPGDGHDGHGDGPGDGRDGHGDGPSDGHEGPSGDGHDGHGGPSGTGHQSDHGATQNHTEHDPTSAGHSDHSSTPRAHSQHSGDGQDGHPGEHREGNGKNHGSGHGGGPDGVNVALPDSGLNDLAPPPGTEIAVTAVALCIILGLFGGFALKASDR
ncbi:MAG: copper resistance protein CopC [Actinomycetota bacterium]|nr:copper resistance protein CopC [Actinomycetota bacterium]